MEEWVGKRGRELGGERGLECERLGVLDGLGGNCGGR